MTIDRSAAPYDQLPTYLDVSNPLVENETFCIWVEPIRIYESGLEFTFHLAINASDGRQENGYRMGSVSPGSPPGIRLEFSNNGITVDNSMDFRAPQKSDTEPVLAGRSSSETDHQSWAVYYYSPLPKNGILDIRIISSDHGLDSVVLTIDAQSISGFAPGAAG